MVQIKLVVGLGNPGRKYAETRHNLGFMVVDFLAHGQSQKFKAGKGEWKQTQLWFNNQVFWAIKPKTYMNRSGLAVRMFCDYHGISRDEVLVICDDINLPLGKMRIRSGGSAGGHKGLVSVMAHLDTDQFARLRVGINLPPEGEESEIYVLKAFEGIEKKVISEMIENAALATLKTISEGLEAAQMMYN